MTWHEIMDRATPEERDQVVLRHLHNVIDSANAFLMEDQDGDIKTYLAHLVELALPLEWLADDLPAEYLEFFKGFICLLNNRIAEILTKREVESWH